MAARSDGPRQSHGKETPSPTTYGGWFHEMPNKVDFCSGTQTSDSLTQTSESLTQTSEGFTQTSEGLTQISDILTQTSDSLTQTSDSWTQPSNRLYLFNFIYLH